jgi:hypothetical protein
VGPNQKIINSLVSDLFLSKNAVLFLTTLNFEDPAAKRLPLGIHK